MNVSRRGLRAAELFPLTVELTYIPEAARNWGFFFSNRRKIMVESLGVCWWEMRFLYSGVLSYKQDVTAGVLGPSWGTH